MLFLINFSKKHLPWETMAQAGELAGWRVESYANIELVDIPLTQEKIGSLIESLRKDFFMPHEWRGAILLVNLPEDSIDAVLIVAELYKRTGSFPMLLRLYNEEEQETMEVINLQVISDYPQMMGHLRIDDEDEE